MSVGEYNSSTLYKRRVFMGNSWGEVADALDEWLNEEVVFIPNKKSRMIRKRDTFVMDIFFRYNDETYVVDAYYTQDMPQ